MPIQYIETCEDDTFLCVAERVADYLNEGQNKTALAETPGSRFLSECTEVIRDQRFADFATLLSSHVDLILAKSDGAKTTEACFNLICHAVSRAPEESQASVATIVAEALAKADDHPEERVTALLNLYNVTSTPSAQHKVLLLAADYSRRNPRVSQLLGGAVKGKADVWIKEWTLPESQTRELLLALASVMKACGDRASAKEYVKLTAAALALAQPGDAEAMEVLKPFAVAALTDFLRSSTIYQCDLMHLPAVAQLAADAQYSALHAFVTKVLLGDFKGCQELVTPDLLSLPGCPAEEALLGKARMVCLLALCARSGHEDVSLAQVQDALCVPKELVEACIVRAIGAKLLEGKIDQVRGVLTVARSTQPTFGPEQWDELSHKLASLKQHLQGALSLVANVKPPQHIAPRMHSLHA